MNALAPVDLDSLSREDLLQVLARDRFVKEQLAWRVANLTTENVELLGVVQELQAALSRERSTTEAREDG